MLRYLFSNMLVLIFLSASNLFTQEQVIPFYPNGTYNLNIPTPESILGFPIGSKPTRYDEIVNYLKILDEKSNEVQLVEFGKTYEGRSLYHLIITSESNFKKLVEIQNSISKLADPRKISSDKDAHTLIESTPAIAWLAYGIHGDELSSPDAAVQLAYQLTAGTDESTIKLKNELIILIDPMENPDGRERYLAQMQQWQGEVVNPDAQAIQHTGVWALGTRQPLFIRYEPRLVFTCSSRKPSACSNNSEMESAASRRCTRDGFVRYLSFLARRSSVQSEYE